MNDWCSHFLSVAYDAVFISSNPGDRSHRSFTFKTFDLLQVAFFIIHYLLIKSDDFRSQVRSFVQEVENTDYWLQEDWHSHHLAFQQVVHQ